VAVLLDEAQVRHYQKWQILGINVGTPEYGDQPDTFSGEIEKFKNWINKRLAWLDANMVGKKSAGNDKSAIYRVFPNPASGILRVESDEIINRIVIYNLTGNPILDLSNYSDYVTSVDVSNLPPGLYIARIWFITGEVVSHRFVKK
jgi:hypothetical protein